MSTLSRFLLTVCLSCMAFIPASNAFACHCIEVRPVAEALSTSDKVFLGKALHISSDRKEIVFQVVKAWKGVTSETTSIIYEYPVAGGCAYAFVIGEMYLVYTIQNRTNICSRTKPSRIASSDMEALGPPAYFNANQNKTRPW